MKARLVGRNAIKPRDNVNSVGKVCVVEKIMRILGMVVSFMEVMRRNTDASKVILSLPH